KIGVVTIAAIERAPGAQRLQENLLILLAHGLVELALLGDLGEQLRYPSLKVGLHRADALRRAAKGARGVKIRVVIELDEGLERNVEPLAVVEQRAMMIGNAPRTRIEVEPRLEVAILGGAAEFGVGIAAADGPVAATGALVEFQDLDLIARLAQLQRRGHAGKSCAEDQDGSAPRIAFELDRPLVARFRGKAEARHRVVHRRAARHRSDQREQIAPACSLSFVMHRCIPVPRAQSEPRSPFLSRKRAPLHTRSLSRGW